MSHLQVEIKLFGNKNLIFIFFFIVFFYCFGKAQADPIEVVIGNQTWSSKNYLNGIFQSGEYIPYANSAAEWQFYAESRISACTAMNFDSSLIEEFGLFYNWFAITDVRGLAPPGWRIPSKQDIEELSVFLGPSFAKALKSQGLWEMEKCISCALKGMSCGECKSESRKKRYTDFGNGTNSSGFDAMPAGAISENGIFRNVDNEAIFWLSDCIIETNLAYCFPLRFGFDDAFPNYQTKGMGFNVRLLKE